MQAHSTQWDASERLQIEYTAKPVSGWGGLVALVRYFDGVGLRALLQQALPDGRTSPNQIPAGEIILAFFAAVLTGAKRFAHVERLRADAVVRAILGVGRIPSAMTLTRSLGGFVRSQVEHLTEVLWQFTLARLRSSPLGAVVNQPEMAAGKEPGRSWQPAASRRQVRMLFAACCLLPPAGFPLKLPASFTFSRRGISPSGGHFPPRGTGGLS